MPTRSILVGAAVVLLACIAFAAALDGRYRIAPAAEQGTAFKIDTWTGRTWIMRYYDKDGVRMFVWVPVPERSE